MLQFRTRVKICCIANTQEAAIAIRYGADAIGLVGAMPSGPGIITDETARQIATELSPPVASFLLTSETTAQKISEHVLDVGASTIQIVSHIDPEESAKLAKLIPMIKRVQVIHVEDDACLCLMEDYQAYYNAFLLDSGKPSAKIPELGGTGRTHDWNISKQIIAKSDLPVFLAGGLTPQNVGDAITRLRPYGIDLCSGVRTDNKLNEARLSAFMNAVHVADQQIR